MHHARAPRLPHLHHLGLVRYFLTLHTAGRLALFIDAGLVEVVGTQIVRTAAEEDVSLEAYRFMPDRLLLVVAGCGPGSDRRRFMTLARQRAAFHSRHRVTRLWQHGYYERVLRRGEEHERAIRDVLGGPVRAGLASTPEAYPFCWSRREPTDP